jgi:hypothetical protein
MLERLEEPLRRLELGARDRGGGRRGFELRNEARHVEAGWRHHEAVPLAPHDDFRAFLEGDSPRQSHRQAVARFEDASRAHDASVTAIPLIVNLCIYFFREGLPSLVFTPTLSASSGCSQIALRKGAFDLIHARCACYLRRPMAAERWLSG